MAKTQDARGSTSMMVTVFIQDNTSATGAGLTGLSSSSTNLQISVRRSLASTVTVYKQSASNIEAQTTIGTFQAPSTSAKCRFKEISSADLPGFYEIQFHDDAGHFGSADASKRLQILVKEETTTALKILPAPVEIELTATNVQDGVRFGMTALPNAAAEASGGLYTRGTGAGQIAQDANGRIDANQKAIIGTALTETSVGYLAAAFKKFLDVATPVLTAASVNQGADNNAILTNATYGNSALKTAIDSVATSVSTGSTSLFAPSTAIRTVGSDQGGTVSNLAAHDESFFGTGENASTGLDVLLTRTTSTIGAKPSVARLSGYYNGTAAHQINVYLYNFTLSNYELIGVMQNRTTAFDYTFPMSIDNHDAATGEMRMRLTHNAVTYNASHRLYLDFMNFEKVSSNDQLNSDIAAIKTKTDQLIFTNENATTNVNAHSYVTVAPTDMALNSTVAKEATLTQTVDGTLTLFTAMKRLIARLIGKSSRVGGAITYRNQADDANEITLTHTDTTRTPS